MKYGAVEPLNTSITLKSRTCLFAMRRTRMVWRVYSPQCR